MRPQDIVVLLKIIAQGSKQWYGKDIAKELALSPAEVSNSLERSVTSGLLDGEKKSVRTQALLEFLTHGLQYIFPQRPAHLSRGVPTAHSHPFMKEHFSSDLQYIWPDAEGDEKGLSVEPLYPGVIKAVKEDKKLYLMLALVDVLRLGKPREKKIAIEELEKLLIQ
jgi:DNA-binding Lrp family transcriptional regulator